MAIKSYVKIKPIKDDDAYSGSFNSIRKGINRTGVVSVSIANNNIETHKLIKFERDYLRKTYRVESKEVKDDDKEKLNIFQKWSKGFKDMFKLQQRDEKEEELEETEKPEKEKKKQGKQLKETATSFMKMLSGFLTPIFTFMVKMGLFKWLTDKENIKKAQKVFQLFVSIGKFVFWLAGGVVGMIAGGLTKLFGTNEQGTKKGFSRVFGFFQLMAGLAGLRYLLNPLKIFTDGKKLMGLFNKTTDAEVTWKKQEQWRKFGYKDKETGKIYTEQEYKAQKKSVERQQKKLRARGQNAQADKIGAKFNNRVKNPTRLQQGKNVGKKMMKPGAQKGLAIVGGVTRIAAGIASGEDATEAVGAGVGQAAGGMIGAALLTPFLGPFGPIVGNALGGFLGEWIGKTFLPVIKPLFEPIKKMFQMLWTVVKGIADETGITEFFGTFFQFVGQIGKVLMDVMGWLMPIVKWLLGGIIKILGQTIGFIINAAKKIFAFMRNPIGFAWDVIRGRDPGRDVQMDDLAKMEGGKVVTKTRTIVQKSRGGIVPFKEPDVIQRMKGGAVHNITTNLTNIEYAKGGKVINKYFWKASEGGKEPSEKMDVPKSIIGSSLSDEVPMAQRNVAQPEQLQAMTANRDKAMAQFTKKARKDADLQDIVLPPRTVVVNNKVPIINTVAVGTNSRAIYTAPSPMFTC
tara:strand:- start:4154 stop:6208 length:2055 start_codon:yes stop_codon:yes gene_type:complete